METTQAIWQTIPGAEPLFEIYGYWPTLHDAVVRELRVGFAERELTLVVDYTDLVQGRENEPTLCARLTLRWFGITESTLRLHSGDLYGIDFVRENDLLETRFTDYDYGLDGTVLSGGVAVTHIELSPVRPEEERLALTLG
jgi:hypothetical protein